MTLNRNERAVGLTGPSYYSVWNRGFFVDGNIHCLMSQDGITFTTRSTFNPYTPHDSTMFGIPSLFNTGTGTLFAAGAVGIDTTSWTAQHFEIAKSTDGNTFTYVATADFTSFFGSSTHPQVWPTSWFRDDDGSVHIIIEQSPNSNLSGDSLIYHLYETHDTSGGLMTSWSNPVQITGLGSASLAAGNSQLDGQIIKQGSTYYLFYKNDHSGKKCINVASSSSLTSGYTEFKIDDWAGWTSGLTVPMEGPCLRQFGASWVAWLDNEGAGIYRSESHTGLFGTWSAPAICNAPFNHMQHGNVIANTFG